MGSSITDIFQQLGLPPVEVARADLAPVEPEQLPAVNEPNQNSDRLTRLVDRSLGTLEEILEQPNPTLGHPNYTKMLSIKKDAAVSVINAGLKADENRFRKRKNDVLADLLKQIQKDKGLPVIDQ